MNISQSSILIKSVIPSCLFLFKLLKHFSLLSFGYTIFHFFTLKLFFL